MIVYRLKIPSSYQPPYVAMPCVLHDDFIIGCPKFGTRNYEFIMYCAGDINGFNPPKSLLKSVQTIEVNFLNKHLWKSVYSV